MREVLKRPGQIERDNGALSCCSKYERHTSRPGRGGESTPGETCAKSCKCQWDPERKIAFRNGKPEIHPRTKGSRLRYVLFDLSRDSQLSFHNNCVSPNSLDCREVCPTSTNNPLSSNCSSMELCVRRVLHWSYRNYKFRCFLGCRDVWSTSTNNQFSSKCSSMKLWVRGA